MRPGGGVCFASSIRSIMIRGISTTVPDHRGYEIVEMQNDDSPSIRPIAWPKQDNSTKGSNVENAMSH
jgi:hypothetical protein